MKLGAGDGSSGKSTMMSVFVYIFGVVEPSPSNVAERPLDAGFVTRTAMQQRRTRRELRQVFISAPLSFPRLSSARRESMAERCRSHVRTLPTGQGVRERRRRECIQRRRHLLRVLVLARVLRNRS